MSDKEPGEGDVPYSHREIFFNAEHGVGQGLATHAGLEESVSEGIETITGVVTDENMMNEVAASQTARDEVLASDVASTEVRASNMAIGKMIVSIAGLNPEDYADMTEVVASETAMNEVAASQTARDEVLAADVASTEVRASNMAIGKMSVGIAGLNPEDYADMAEVAASETAMAAVGSSVLAVTEALAGTASDSLWSSASADSMRVFLENGGGLDTPGDTDLPHTVSGTSGFVYDADEMDGFYGLDAQVAYNDSPSNRSTDRTWVIRFDASNFDYIKLEHEAVGDFRRNAVIEIDGSEVLSISSNSSLQERSFNISDISGEVDIAIGVENDWWEADDLTEIFATRLRLE